MKLTLNICVVLSTLAILLGQSEGQSHGFGSSISKFSVDMFKLLVHASFEKENEPENVVFSPASAFRALLLLRFASGGDSKAQMDKALHLEDVSDVPTEYKKWKSSKLDGVKEADRVYHDSSVSVVGNIKKLLGKGIETVNMRDAATVAQINDWVSQATEGQISELVQELEDDVRLILLSALYMRAEWTTPFHDVKTQKFTLTNRNTVNVPMMFRESKMKYYDFENLHCEVVALDYKDSTFKFMAFLPYEDNTLESLVDSLSMEAIETAIGRLSVANVQLHLPKFRVQKEIDLTDFSKELGIVDVFDVTKANFPSFKSSEPLSVREVLQKVVVDVDKDGTTASAVTEAAIFGRSALTEFNANKPFIYMIYDSSSKTQLFMGTMMNPAE